MKSLKHQSDEELQEILRHANQAFGEVAEFLDADPATVQAVQTLLRSESVLEDYTTLLVSEPETTQKVLNNSLSALVNVHLSVTVGRELERRSQSN